MQPAPVQPQIPALQVQDAEPSQVMLQTSPLQEQLLESVQVKLQPPFGFSHFASQLSEPLHV